MNNYAYQGQELPQAWLLLFVFIVTLAVLFLVFKKAEDLRSGHLRSFFVSEGSFPAFKFALVLLMILSCACVARYVQAIYMNDVFTRCALSKNEYPGCKHFQGEVAYSRHQVYSYIFEVGGKRFFASEAYWPNGGFNALRGIRQGAVVKVKIVASEGDVRSVTMSSIVYVEVVGA